VALTKGKSILVIAPNLIAESLSLKLTSLDNKLKISIDASNKEFFPDLIIWNVLNYESADLIRIEFLKLKEIWTESKFLIIFSGDFNREMKSIPQLTSEGLLLNPSADKVLQALNNINEGGRVFDIDQQPFNRNKTVKKSNLNQKLLTSGLKQIDTEINTIMDYLNNNSLPDLYKFILKGRLRELITAKSFLIFLWGNLLDLYTDQIFNENYSNEKPVDKTIFIKDKKSLEVWKLILERLLDKYSHKKLNKELSNSTVILSGLKKEYISRLICNILNELDDLIKNIIENYEGKDYTIDLISFINELNKKALSNITDNYLRVKRNGNSISLNDFIFNELNYIENDSESHDLFIIIDPIINNGPLIYDGKILPLYEIESFEIFEKIISNWAIRSSNLLAAELFNFCSNWPELRTILINSPLQSTRSFERFRNNINNYNRWHNNIYMPIYLYESKHEFIDILDNKIIRYFKNENREKDLEKLDWFQKQVTLVIEIRDALAPQIELAIKYIGEIFITLLTKIVGKGIGLVGKGILQGLGKSTSK
tara:strand:+ start:857 stop:2476 length:1620 start_codon:yes stop_codon:yes gene_type:complete